MRHHYVPQFYLRRFAEADGRVRRYAVAPNGALLEAPISPKSTAYVDGLYEARSGTSWDSYNPDIIETEVMSPADNDAAKVMAKLCGGVNELSDRERTAWALFLNSLRFRHRDEIFERDAAAPDLVKSLLATYTPAMRKALRNVDVIEMAKTAHRTQMVKEIQDQTTIDRLKAMAWDVLQVALTMPLLTTDRPLQVNLGKGGPPDTITIALSPRHLFVAYPQQWRTDATVSQEIPGALEAATLAHDLTLIFEQPCRYVYTSRELDDNFNMGDKRVLLRTAVEQALKKWQ